MSTPISKLESSLNKILKEYAESVYKDTDKLTRQFTKKGVQAVKQASKATFGGTGKYASGWTSQMETGRLSTQGTIYNKTVPGLPHLLENGHANRGGGRTPGRKHIAPVEEKLVQEFEKAVRDSL